MNYRKGAKGALLDEYERAIASLKTVLEDIGDDDWTVIVDTATADENCRSMQAIMTHVVSSAYSYATYIGQHKGLAVERPPKAYFTRAVDYKAALDGAFRFTESAFEHLSDDELEQPDEALKIKTAVSWGQTYDIEQMMEHAIVHILRHRRQIQRLMPALRS